MNRLWLIAIVCCVGCDLTRPVTPVDPSTPVVTEEKVDDASVFESLARRVEKKRIRNTYNLARVVKALEDASELSASGRGKFDAAFPGSSVESNQRDIDPVADAKSLRGCK